MFRALGPGVLGASVVDIGDVTGLSGMYANEPIIGGYTQVSNLGFEDRLISIREFKENTVAVVETLIGLYAFDTEILGARPSAGAFLPIGYASVDTDIVGSGPLWLAGQIEEDGFGVGDISAIPLSLFWTFEALDLHVNLYEVVVIPSGQYDTSNLINLGRNYWSFDTVLATTWLSAETGTELSTVQGFLANTENEQTNYRTGLEYHVDLMLNQFLTERFAVGFHFYSYQQLTADSGTSSTLGNFK